MKYIVHLGEVADGIETYGPFDDEDDAQSWITHNLSPYALASVAQLRDPSDWDDEFVIDATLAEVIDLPQPIMPLSKPLLPEPIANRKGRIVGVQEVLINE